jgi:hypothetical protein
MATKPTTKKQPAKTYILPAGTAAFPHIDKPDTEGKFADNKFKVRMVWDGDVDLAAIRATIEKEAKAHPEYGDSFDPETFAFPFREWGDDAEKEEFRGKITADVKSKFKPQVVDAKRKDVVTKGLKMAGDTIKAMVTLYFYQKTEKVKAGKKMVDETVYGCSLQLVAVQIIEKRSGGGGNYAGGFDEEDGYSSEDDAGAETDGGAGGDDDEF